MLWQTRLNGRKEFTEGTEHGSDSWLCCGIVLFLSYRWITLLQLLSLTQSIPWSGCPPRKKAGEDHLALMMELLGMMPRKIALGGRYSRDFFNRYGDLRHIRRLRFWPLNKVLSEKYEFNEQDASALADFLLPILDFVPENRPTAAQCLLHPWISSGPRLLEPSLPSIQSQADDTVNSEKNKRDEEEREAMEVGMGNIAINTDKPSKKAIAGPST
ncbi:ser/arg-rich protein kinase 4 [Actinidia rufa]|uniref:non-specific serine/threonine protein kinase n=1 Tax=Actinidia rufa TaxID=165716 RepID=A0A7J0FVJ0_9ERIC|nr:ser/arg-rich protein kinase 4 [Actinidia rufa]